MDMQHVLVPIALFACITYLFKAVLDAVMRARMLREPGTEDLLHAILKEEQQQRRLSSLRWGLLLLALAGGFAIIHAIGWVELSTGALAILLACAGLGHLIFYALTRNRT
ncbi:MAG: hypothetical protein ABI304_03060 [Rudaea sp.]